MIGLAYRDALPPDTVAELDQLTQGLTGMLYEEHDPDGTHTDITADSLTLNKPNLTTGVAGTIVFQDRLGFKSTISRNDTGDSILTLANGYKFVVKRSDLSGTLYTLAALGLITYGGSSGNGIAIYGLDDDGTPLPTVFNDWGIVSGNSNALPGARLEIADITTGLSPISLRYRSGVPAYEWMKTTGGSGPTTELVTLGSGLDSSLAGYWDALYVKSITLGNGLGGATAMGVWADIPFSSGDYGGHNSMTWTNITDHNNSYTTVGPTVTLAYNIVGDVGGTPSDYLKFTLPNGWAVSGRTVRAAIGWCDNGGTPELGYCQATPSDTFIRFYLGSLANWAGGGVTSAVYGEITFSING